MRVSQSSASGPKQLRMTVIPPEDPTSDSTCETKVDGRAAGAVGQRSLRTRVLNGGIYLAVREGLGVVVGLVGAVLLTRMIGPADFGLYIALITLFFYLQNLTTVGVNTYLVRSEGPLQNRSLDEAFTLLLALSAAGALLGEIALPLIVRFTHLSALESLGSVALLALPLVVTSQVPLARLEHDLEFRRVAIMEGTAQVLLYAVALPLAHAGWGAEAAVAGWLTQQLFLVCCRFVLARYRPMMRYSGSATSQMMRYGLSFSSSLWVWQLRSLVNPIIVARYGGATAVGMVGLASRLVENLGFVKVVTWRMSIAALGRVQRSPTRLLSAVEQGMSLQLLALGPALVAFACLGDLLLPIAFGHEWSSALNVFPYIAAGYLVNAAFNLHSSALYVVRRNWTVTRFHLAYVTVFAFSALALVPEAGVRGYGVAELAALPSYWLIHRGVRKNLGSPRYLIAAAWLCGFGAALFVKQIGWWMSLPLLAVLCWPATWHEVCRYVSLVRVAQ